MFKRTAQLSRARTAARQEDFSSAAVSPWACLILRTIHQIVSITAGTRTAITGATAEIMRKNRGILKELKAATCKDMVSALKAVDQDLLKAAVAGEKFQEYFFANATDEGIRDYIKGLVGAKVAEPA